MRENDLPERWRHRVREHALAISAGKYTSLGVSAFGNRRVILAFPDGSTVTFEHAFVLHDHEQGELGVFTEHCGYHVFPLVETEVHIPEHTVA